MVLQLYLSSFVLYIYIDTFVYFVIQPSSGVARQVALEVFFLFKPTAEKWTALRELGGLWSVLGRDKPTQWFILHRSPNC